jgi:hypothetical protein
VSICLPCSTSVTVSPLISRCNRIWGTYNAFASLVLVSPHGMPSWQGVTLHMPSSAWACTSSCAQCTECSYNVRLSLSVVTYSISSDHRWCVEKCETDRNSLLPLHYRMEFACQFLWVHACGCPALCLYFLSMWPVWFVSCGLVTFLQTWKAARLGIYC